MYNVAENGMKLVTRARIEKLRKLTLAAGKVGVRPKRVCRARQHPQLRS